MAFCPSCGSQVDGRFCAKCGTPVAADPGTGATVPPPAVSVQAAGLQDNVAAALCYALGLLTGILFLVLAPYNQNRLIRFHAFQSIFLHVALIVFYFVLSIIFGALINIPFLGAMLALTVWPLVGLACLILWIMLMYKAYNNQKWVLPFIGPLAEKQANA
jgi:uncharacterized membrane protein